VTGHLTDAGVDGRIILNGTNIFWSVWTGFKRLRIGSGQKGATASAFLLPLVGMALR
jgi:hypothetical protein